MGVQACRVRMMQESADYWGGDDVPWMEDNILSIFVHNVAVLYRDQVVETHGGGVLPWVLFLARMSSSFPIP